MPEIEIPPGIVKTTTGLSAMGRFIDADKVRFFAGKAQKIGGWIKMNQIAMVGVPRAAHAYMAADGTELHVFATERKLYYMDADNELHNITPIRASTTINRNPFLLTDGSTTVTVTDTAHGAVKDDTVTFSGGVFGDSHSVSGEFVIVAIVDEDHYTIELASAPTMDPNEASTVLLMHFNGANLSTTIYDDAPTDGTFTAVDNAKLSTAQKKFGATSLLLDGTGDYVDGDGDAAYALGTGNFTIEAWVRFDTFTGIFQNIYDARPTTTEGFYPQIYVKNDAKVYFRTNSIDSITSTNTLSVNTWYHIALCRSGNDHRLFINGVKEGSTYTAANTYLNGASRPRIGASGFDATDLVDGYIDELRVSTFAYYASDGPHTVPTTAFGLANDGGQSVVAAYEINVGTVDPALSDGYGVGDYGYDGNVNYQPENLLPAYGTPRAVNLAVLDARFWTLDNYGTWLIASYQGGTIYKWDRDSDERAITLTNAPTDMVACFVTEERFIMALRAGLVLSWPDRDVPTDWTPTEINTANTRILATGMKFVAGTALGHGVSLVWTESTVYQLQFTGGPFIYDSMLAGDNAGLAGPGAWTTVNGIAFWMSHNAFHMFTGSVQAIPNSSHISDWLFRNVREGMHTKTTSFFNATYREVWWIFPSLTDEPDTYVAVNIDEFFWTVGTLARVGATVQTGGAAHPLLTSVDGYVYEHELPSVNAEVTDPIAWHLETGYWRVPGGERNVDIFGFNPDFERLVGTVTLTVEAVDRPQSIYVDTEEGSIDSTTDGIDLRLSGRFFKYRLSQNEVDGDFREGLHLLTIQPAGERP